MAPRRTLGRTGLAVGRLGLGSSYGLAQADVEWAFDRGCNYLYWGSLRRGGFGRALRHLAATRRDELVFVIQSYHRVGWMLRHSVHAGLRKVKTSHADVLLLGMYDDGIPDRVLAAARRLQDRGDVRFLAASTHQRAQAARWLHGEEPLLDVVHVRYNAAHRGAEEEVFPHAAASGLGLVSFTATRWGTLLKAQPGVSHTPSAAECYRFVLGQPAVGVCLAGPKDRGELEEAVTAAEAGPLDPETAAAVRAFGDRLYAARSGRGETSFLRR